MPPIVVRRRRATSNSAWERLCRLNGNSRQFLVSTQTTTDHAAPTRHRPAGRQEMTSNKSRWINGVVLTVHTHTHTPHGQAAETASERASVFNRMYGQQVPISRRARPPPRICERTEREHKQWPNAFRRWSTPSMTPLFTQLHACPVHWFLCN